MTSQASLMTTQPVEPPPLEPTSFRQVMGGFATGVAIVTTVDDDQPHGMTVNSLTAVSLDPLLLLVCLTKASRTLDAIQSARRFVVNLLARDQRELSNNFARPGEDHFEDVSFETTSDGLPIIGGGVGYLVCEVERIEDGGDHEVVLGAVRGGGVRPGEPLLFYRGRYGRFHADVRSARDIGLDWFG